MSEKILFVTKAGEQCDEGFTYALELAKTLHAGIDILIVNPGRIMGSFENMMGAVAFAEAGEFTTARELMESEQKELKELCDKKIGRIIGKASEMPVELNWQLAKGDIIPLVKEHLKKRRGINMVLLSPSLTKGAVNIRKLLKNISRPIVTMSRLVKAKA